MKQIKFNIVYHPVVKKDIKKLKLDKSTQLELKTKIENVCKNPYPKHVGGLGEPLKGDLKGLLKFKFKRDYRVVYQLEYSHNQMRVLIVGIDVYQQLSKRHG